MCFLLFPLHTFCNLSKTPGSSHKWRFISWDNVTWFHFLFLLWVIVTEILGEFFGVLFKVYLFFCLPLQTGLQGWGCVCTALPYFPNPGEVLEVVTLGSSREVPKSGSAHEMLQKSCLVPAHWGCPGWSWK